MKSSLVNVGACLFLSLTTAPVRGWVVDPFFSAPQAIAAGEQKVLIPACFAGANSRRLNITIVPIDDLWNKYRGVYATVTAFDTDDFDHGTVLCTNAGDVGINYCLAAVPASGAIWLRIKRSEQISQFVYQVNVKYETSHNASFSGSDDKRRLGAAAAPTVNMTKTILPADGFIMLNENFVFSDTVVNRGNPAFHTMFTCAGQYFPNAYYVKTVLLCDTLTSAITSFLCKDVADEKDCNALTYYDNDPSEAAINELGYRKSVEKEKTVVFLAVYGFGTERDTSTYTGIITIEGGPTSEAS